jgi:hypothetical protein
VVEVSEGARPRVARPAAAHAVRVLSLLLGPARHRQQLLRRPLPPPGAPVASDQKRRPRTDEDQRARLPPGLVEVSEGARPRVAGAGRRPRGTPTWLPLLLAPRGVVDLQPCQALPRCRQALASNEERLIEADPGHALLAALRLVSLRARPRLADAGPNGRPGQGLSLLCRTQGGARHVFQGPEAASRALLASNQER